MSKSNRQIVSEIKMSDDLTAVILDTDAVQISCWNPSRRTHIVTISNMNKEFQRNGVLDTLLDGCVALFEHRKVKTRNISDSFFNEKVIIDFHPDLHTEQLKMLCGPASNLSVEEIFLSAVSFINRNISVPAPMLLDLAENGWRLDDFNGLMWNHNIFASWLTPAMAAFKEKITNDSLFIFNDSIRFSTMDDYIENLLTWKFIDVDPDLNFSETFSEAVEKDILPITVRTDLPVDVVKNIMGSEKFFKEEFIGDLTAFEANRFLNFFASNDFLDRSNVSITDFQLERLRSGVQTLAETHPGYVSMDSFVDRFANLDRILTFEEAESFTGSLSYEIFMLMPYDQSIFLALSSRLGMERAVQVFEKIPGRHHVGWSKQSVWNKKTRRRMIDLLDVDDGSMPVSWLLPLVGLPV